MAGATLLPLPTDRNAFPVGSLFPVVGSCSYYTVGDKRWIRNSVSGARTKFNICIDLHGEQYSFKTKRHSTFLWNSLYCLCVVWCLKPAFSLDPCPMCPNMNYCDEIQRSHCTILFKQSTFYMKINAFPCSQLNL